MALRLTLAKATRIPIEVAGLTPTAARGKTLAEIEHWQVQHGNRSVALAELFTVRGTADDARIEFEGDTGGVHSIGAAMSEGEIRVAGAVGRHCGSEMTGGTIHVAGDAGDWLGAEMREGLINVRGNAGNHVGAAYSGSERGMRGGKILVGGNAGAEVAHTMRRGLIAVGGSIGDFAAINMGAGTLFVFGSCGARPAAGMRRGTLALFGDRPKLLPTFRSGGTCRPLFLRIYLRTLERCGLAIARELEDAVYEVFHGDMLAGARGEVLVRQ